VRSNATGEDRLAEFGHRANRVALRLALRSTKGVGDHLSGYTGIMRADAFAGFNGLYNAKRRPAPITEAAC
jgi:hypothetical protein